MPSTRTYHRGSDGYERHLAKVWGVDDADGALVLGEHVGESRVHRDRVHRVELAAHVRYGLESPAHWEVEPVVVLRTPVSALAAELEALRA